jgi:hypothetical protein
MMARFYLALSDAFVFISRLCLMAAYFLTDRAKKLMGIPI